MNSTLVLSIVWFQPGPYQCLPSGIATYIASPSGGISLVAMSLGKPFSVATLRETGIGRLANAPVLPMKRC